jgi:iron-sulfur cluster repair protein YtfE (RIC family)
VGALIQEAIDVAVILNALRALRGGEEGGAAAAGMAEIGRKFRDEHRRLLPEVRRLRHVADRLDLVPPGEARAELTAMRRFLTQELLPHEKAEDAAVYPAVARLIGGSDPTATMSRAHLEIAHLAVLFNRLVDELPEEGPGPEDVRELRRILYGLHAILRLHFAQEDESYLALIDARAERDSGPGRVTASG